MAALKAFMEQEDFGTFEKELAHYTRAIGHPARVAVMLAIARKGSEMRGEIVDVPPLSKATVVQHLRELKRAGFIQGRIFGTKAHYYLDKSEIGKFSTLFKDFQNSMETKDAP